MHTNEKINEKTLKVYEFIKDYSQNFGYSPSLREICKALDISSTSTVSYYIAKLDKLGYIKKNKNKNRAMGILAENKGETTKLSYLNKDENYEYNESSSTASIVISKDFFKDMPSPSFIYQITQNDCIDERLSVGDKVFLTKQIEYHIGDYIMVKLDGINYFGTMLSNDKNLYMDIKNNSINIAQCEIIGKIVNIVKFIY